MIGQRAELVASRQPGADETAAYERVLGDALEGDATLFARMDYVEEAWRIVDPVRTMNTPVREYEPGTWGPADAPRTSRRPEGGPIRRCRRGPRMTDADRKSRAGPPSSHDWRTRASGTRRGENGGRTSASGSGEPCARTTARTATRGIISRTTTRDRAPTTGERTGSPASAI